MSQRKHHPSDDDIGTIEKVSQSSIGDNNVQIKGNSNVVSVTNPPTTTSKQSWESIRLKKISIIVAIIAIVVPIYFGNSNNRDSSSESNRRTLPKSVNRKTINSAIKLESKGAIKQHPAISDTVRLENGKATMPSGGAKMGSSDDNSKQAEITQIAHGNKNVQIVGNSNVVDNSTYVFTAAPNSKLSYFWTGVERSVDGMYTGTITLESTGTIPFYHPKWYVRLDRGIQRINCGPVHTSVLFDERESRSKDNNSYSYTTRELIPGAQMKILLVNDSPFDIAEFKINDEWCFGSEPPKHAKD